MTIRTCPRCGETLNIVISDDESRLALECPWTSCKGVTGAGRMLGRRGGLARKASQSAKQLSAQGKKAARARWAKRPKA